VSTRTAVPVARRISTRQLKTTSREIPSAGALFLPPAPSAGPSIVSARAGDHPTIHRLLLAAFHGPAPAEFQRQIEQPGYDPADRLLVRHGDTLAAHVRLCRQVISLGAARVSSVRVMDLATAAEYRGHGFATALVAAAEKQAREQGALLALTRTKAPALFARHGWSVCGRHVFSTAGARQFLAQMQATSAGLVETEDSPTACLRPSTRQPITVRPLRRIELPAAMRLYDESLATRYGSPVRSEAYWDWLLGRGACDRIYIASEGPDSPDLARQLSAVRGAVFAQRGRIVELIAAPGRDDVKQHLAARVCADASEQDQWQVRLDAPPDEPLHALFRAAGGQSIQAEEFGGETFMAKVLAPRAFVTALGATLAARLPAVELKGGVQLGLEILVGAKPRRTHTTQVARLRLDLSPRGLTLESANLGRHYLSLRLRDLAPLFLGHWELADLIESGRIRASSKTARRLGAMLFPKLPWWRPPLDDLLA
jgi:GNAT superfamily N-acetyltransferase